MFIFTVKFQIGPGKDFNYSRGEYLRPLKRNILIEHLPNFINKTNKLILLDSLIPDTKLIAMNVKIEIYINLYFLKIG